MPGPAVQLTQMQHASPISYLSIVGFTIAQLRRSSDVPQERVATAVGIGQSGYSKLERGVRAMTVPQLRSVARELQVSEQRILDLAAALRAAIEAKGIRVVDEKSDGSDVADVTALLEELWPTLVVPKRRSAS